MLLRKLTIATVLLLSAQKTIAEECQKCTRPGFHFATQPTVAMPLDLIAPHPTTLHDDGPLLLAPAVNARSAPPVPRLIRDYDVRVASKVEERPARAEKNAELEGKLAELKELQRQVDALRAEMGATQQILVKVKMLEVSRTKLRQMGTDIDLASGKFYKASNAAELQKFTHCAPHENALTKFIDCLCQNNVAGVLAEPNLVVVTGRPAQLCVGGEIPMPARGDSPTAIEFQKFGTQVDLVACAIGEDRVRLEVRTRFSELDEARKVTLGNFVIPALNVRELDTAFESKFGESTLLCGATQNRTKARSKVNKDGVTEISADNDEIALLVVVTPEAIDPITTSKNVDQRVTAEPAETTTN